MEHDMSSGKPARLLFFFMLPILGGNLFQQFYSMVDTFVVGRYVGVDAWAELGETGSITFLIMALWSALPQDSPSLSAKSLEQRTLQACARPSR